jgi:hypothetical protein
MRLFRRDEPEPERVRTRATIERVVVTATDEDDDPVPVYLTFAFDDEQGRAVVQEQRFMLGSASIPLPGSSVDVAYGPERIDYNPRSLRPPDPSTPRGWGAGIFEVPDWGTEKSRTPLERRDINAQRELFQTGPRVHAEIVNVLAQPETRRAGRRYTLTLRAAAATLEADIWLPESFVPDEGGRIQIAVRDDDAVALDTDERFDGPPLQAIVVGAAHGAGAHRMVLDRQLATLAQSRQFNPRGYEASVRTALDIARSSGVITQAEHDRLLRDALS